MITVRLRVAGIYYNQVLEVEESDVDSGTATVKDALDKAREVGGGISTPGGFDYQALTNMQAGESRIVRVLTISHNFRGEHISYDDTYETGPADLEPGEPEVPSDLSLGKETRKAGLYTLTSQPVSGAGDVRLVWQHYVVAENGRGPRRSRTRPGKGFTDFTDEPIFDQDEITYRLIAVQFSPNSRATHEDADLLSPRTAGARAATV